jgi:hypothetical protein
VHGVLWRNYLDWAVANVPFYFQPVVIAYWTVFFFFFAAPARRAVVANLAVVLPGSSRWINYLRAYRTLMNFAFTIGDAASYKVNRSEFTYEIIGAEPLEQLARAKGAIVLTAHMISAPRYSRRNSTARSVWCARRSRMNKAASISAILSAGPGKAQSKSPIAHSARCSPSTC